MLFLATIFISDISITPAYADRLRRHTPASRRAAITSSCRRRQIGISDGRLIAADTPHYWLSPLAAASCRFRHFRQLSDDFRAAFAAARLR